IPAYLLPGRTPLDALLVQGINCPASAWDEQGTYSAVSGALVHSFDYEQQSQLIKENREEWRHFFERLVRPFLSRKGGENSFDSWLKREHEKGLGPPLPSGSRLAQGNRDEARRRSNAYYRHVLWSAYQAASRCYGALMLAVWTDFCRSPLLSAT